MSNTITPVTQLSSEEKRALLARLLKEKASKPKFYPLSFAQQRLWILDQLEPNTAAYNIPSAVRLTGRLDVAALEQTFNEIKRRHGSLRTTFSVIDDQPVQVLNPVQQIGRASCR